MPIINTGYKREMFLKNISRHLCGGNERWAEVDEGAENGKTIYFGGGYWRGLWTENEVGVTLTNPDVSGADRRVVEQALCILQCGKYHE
jgi:hypothetical protein